MTEWGALFKIGLALFAIVNPIGSVPIFITATSGSHAAERARLLRMVAITVFTVLTLSVFLGDRILEFFGISIASFQTGGGILLLMMAISMMHAKQSGARQSIEEAQAVAEREATAIVPLSIPLLAGPGAISSMIIAAQQNSGLWWHAQLMAPIAAVALLAWAILSLSGPIANRLGTIGINIFTRLMGLILAAMAVEFIAHGLTGLFPALANG
jgi:multiple antibiotic resistance protein